MKPCPYCRNPPKLVTGDTIYPLRPDLHRKLFWQCKPCDAYVGCHESGKGTTPYGLLANKELRKARMAAHAAFDPLWKIGGMKRKEAYHWLAECLGVPYKKCHISWLGLSDCLRVPALVAGRSQFRVDDLEYSEMRFDQAISE